MLRALIPILTLFLTITNALHAETCSTNKVPIVYSQGYNLGINSWIDPSLAWLHPFDIKKYSKIHRHLKNTFHLKDDQFYLPIAVTNTDLLEVHTQEYLDSLLSSVTISKGV